MRKKGERKEKRKLGEGEGEGDEENEEFEDEEDFGHDDYAQKVPHTEKVQDVKHTKTGPKHLLSSASIERYASFICRNVLISKKSSSDSSRFAQVSLLIENQISLDILVLFCILSLLPKSSCCFLTCDRNSVCKLVGKVLSLPVTI
jgi:hypothetical protein